MAKRIREKLWKCSDCGSDGILGRHKECPNCGSPREKGEMRSLAGQGTSVPVVTDPELLAKARAGADWFCTHCTSGNIGNGSACSKCGAPRYATAEEDHPEFRGDHRRVEGSDARLERAMSLDPRPPESGRTPPPPPRRPPPPPRDYYEPPSPPPRSNLATILVGGGVFAALGLVIWFFVWAFSTHDVRGEVTEMTWTRTVHVEAWTQTTARLWKHQTSERAEVPPSYGSGGTPGLALVPGSCRSEQFDTERYVCGSHEECKDVYRDKQEDYTCTKSEEYVCGETCSDLGNGFEECDDKYCTRDVSATCTRTVSVFDHKECWDEDDYCTRPIMKDRCDYRTQEWREAGAYPASGRGTEFRWAAVNPGPLDRATYSATYKVAYTYKDGGEVKHEGFLTEAGRGTKASAESAASTGTKAYSTWQVGDPVALKVNNLGGVASAEHAQR